MTWAQVFFLGAVATWIAFFCLPHTGTKGRGQDLTALFVIACSLSLLTIFAR